MHSKLIGRQKEQKILKKALNSDESEMIAVTGRRRVGKTFLVRAVYKKDIELEFTGVQHASRREQLDSFHFLLQRYSQNEEKSSSPKNWLEAFHQLITVLEEEKTIKKSRWFFLMNFPGWQPKSQAS